MSGVVHPIKKEDAPNAIETFQLFPTHVSAIKNNNKETKKELAFLTGGKYRANTGNQTSEDTYILNNAEVSGLRHWIEKAVENYFADTYRPKNEVSLRITQSWVNKTTAEGFHHKHSHPNSLVSGVYYFQGNEDDKIFFERGGSYKITIPTKDHTPFNSESWWLPARQGTLILFPSDLVHWVNPVKGKTRYSLSFNTFPIGILGDNQALTELKL